MPPLTELVKKMPTENLNEHRVRMYLDTYNPRIDHAIRGRGYSPEERLQMANYIKRDVETMLRFDISPETRARVIELGSRAVTLEWTLLEHYASSNSGAGRPVFA